MISARLMVTLHLTLMGGRHLRANANGTRRCAMELKQLVAIPVVSGGLGLSAVGLGIGMAHAEPTSPSPAPPTGPSKPPGPDLPPGVVDVPAVPLPLGP